MIILDELDLGREAANACQLRRNFEHSKLLYVPQVYWDYTCRNVFVMERISGIPVTDMAAMQARGTDLKLLAERGVEIFFTQVFRDSFFHADMHPGNIFVDTTDPVIPATSPSTAPLSAASATRTNTTWRATCSVSSSAITAKWPSSTWTAACGPAADPRAGFRGRDAGGMRAGFRTADRRDLLRAAADLPVPHRRALRYAHTTLAGAAAENTAEHRGLGRQLYPGLNLWDTVKPFLENWVQERYSPQSFLRRLQRQAPSWLEQLPQLPDVMLDSLQQSRDADLRLARQQNQLEEQRQRSGERTRRQRRQLLAAVACLGAAISVLPGGWEQLAAAPLVSWLLAATALALLWPRDS